MNLALITAEEFHRISELGIFNERAELIRGVVFDPAPKTPLHRKTSQRLYDHFLALNLPGYTIFAGSPLTLRDSEPLPDVCVVTGDVSDFDHRHPSTAELVIEVAVTTADADRGKAAIYAEANVKEYWIVLPTERQVEVYRRPGNGQYGERQIVAQEKEIVCEALPAIRVSLAALFA
ncbi:MAG TPA: Uma2 family endonuclease [Chthoniobacteraceae bacterium]|jgi:Uma2 family endonuclease|nr:Uma2 family endonuclease [Chthoniobacteraceae bacterium]